MRFIQRIPFHPIGFATFPVLGLVVSNISSPNMGEVRWLMGLSLGLTLASFALFLLVRRESKRAAAASSLFLLLFFSYGHTHILLGRTIDPTLWLSAIWIALLIGGSYWLLRGPFNAASLTQVLNIVCLILVAPQIVTLAIHALQEPNPADENPCAISPPPVERMLPVRETDSLPDIYYIVLDAYGRSDILQGIYGVDNAPLLDFLRENGFYVAERSTANYDQTFLSIPSSLNMEYVQNLVCTQGKGAFDYWELVDLARHNQVFAIAQEAGYRLVSFRSGDSLTEITNVDHYLASAESVAQSAATEGSLLGVRVKLTPFEVLFLDTTLLRPVLPVLYRQMPEDPAYQIKRDSIRFAFENLAKYSQSEGHYFVFAHIMAPHPPFVFQADGQPRRQWRPFSIVDGSHWLGRIGTRADYIAGYREQLLYVNRLLMEAIEEILAASDPSPVIILQGDHGPGAFFDWNSRSRTELDERFGILNAYHFPGGDGGWLYSEITPLNSFRVVFDRYLDQDFELLEEQAYYSKWSDPYGFVDVTGSLH
jgi:hypothetical protein